METITAARITAMPKSFTDPMPEVHVTVDGEERMLFRYYPDEISFRADEFVGKTLEEARRLRFDKDKAWLQS